MMQDIIPNYLRQRLVNLVDLPLRVIAPRACMRNSGFSLPSEIAMHFFFLFFGKDSKPISSVEILLCKKTLYTMTAFFIPVG